MKALCRFPRVPLALAALTFFGLVPAAQAVQSVRTDLWVPNGLVRASAIVGNTLYIGGDFDYVGPATGHTVALDSTSGVLAGSLPTANGDVDAIVSDGAGGWYVGGDFSAVGGIVRQRLAHVSAAGTVDPNFAPTADGPVKALALVGTRLYVGGSFSNLNGVPRSRFGAVNAASGALTSFDPRPANTNGGTDAAVTQLAVSGNVLYAIGDFNRIAGQTRPAVAAFVAATGLLTSWVPQISSLELVTAVTATSGTVYLGSLIRTGPGSFRAALDAVNATTGAVRWERTAFASPNAFGLAGNRVIAAGRFDAGFGNVQELAAFDATSGSMLAWNPAPNNAVRTLVTSGTTVYAGGNFTALGATTRLRLAAIDAVSAAVLPWNPVAGGNATSLAFDGATVVAGGEFTSVGGVARPFIAGLDLTSGQATAFNPNLDGSVTTITPVGTSIYITGGFSRFAGVLRNRGAGFSVSTGQPNAFNPPFTPGSYITAASDGRALYVGGFFFNFDVNGGLVPRGGLAGLRLSDGALLARYPDTDNEVDSLRFAGGRLYVGGQFFTVGGQQRHGLASITAQGRVTSWNPVLTPTTEAFRVRQLFVSGSAAYVAGEFEAVGSTPRRAFAAFDVANGALLPFNPAPSFLTAGRAIAVSDGVAYVGFITADGQIGGATRFGLAALDAKTGAATPFVADVVPGSDFDTPNSPIDAISVTPSTIYVGGDFGDIANSGRANLAGVAR